MTFNITFLLFTILSSAMSTTSMTKLPEQLLDNVLNKAFAPLLARQDEVEQNALARLETLQSSITVDEIPDQLIGNAVHDALAPLLARQEAMENKTSARLEALQALVLSLASIVNDVYQTNNNTEHPNHHSQHHTLPSAPPSPHAPEYPPREIQTNPNTKLTGSFSSSRTSNRTSLSKITLFSSVRASQSNKATAFFCNICRKKFRDLTCLDVHIRANHRSLECSLCSKTLRSQPELNHHQYIHHSPVLPTGGVDDNHAHRPSSVCQPQMLLSPAQEPQPAVKVTCRVLTTLL